LPFDTKPLNSYSIVCRKKAEDTVVVSGITDAGNIDPVSVPGVPGAGPNIGDKVSALEGEVQGLRTLDTEVTELKQALPNIQGLLTTANAEIGRLKKTGDGHAVEPVNKLMESPAQPSVSTAKCQQQGEVMIGINLQSSEAFPDGNGANRRVIVSYSVICDPKYQPN